PAELGGAMPLRMGLPTLEKSPLTSSLLLGWIRMEKTSPSKPGLNRVSTPPDWASAGELNRTANAATMEQFNATSRCLFTISSVPSNQFRSAAAGDCVSRNAGL